jgi:hypothetical protein
MNGPRSTGPAYTGKHRRPTGPGALPPAWAAQPPRPGPPARPEPHLRPVPPVTPLPDSAGALRPGLRPEPGQLTSERWADAG